jgi:hypothetical protein
MNLAIVMLCLYPNHAVSLHTGDTVYNSQGAKSHTASVTHDYCLAQDEDSPAQEWPESIREMGYYQFTKGSM